MEGLSGSCVAVRRSSSLQVGERIYAMGAPKGLELTLSEGLMSGLRDKEGVRIIQTTAPISPGSSGGGLFDVQGKLVGITTFYLAEGQDLNFALPGDWVLALDYHEISAGSKVDANSPKFKALAWAIRGKEAATAGNYEQALVAWRKAVRLTPDDAAAWGLLALVCNKLGQHQQALGAAREAMRLKPDSAEVWAVLGTVYVNLGQHQQAAEASREATRLKPGIAVAWNNLGVTYALQGNRSKVMEVFQQLTTLDPELADKFFQKVVLP